MARLHFSGFPVAYAAAPSLLPTPAGALYEGIVRLVSARPGSQCQDRSDTFNLLYSAVLNRVTPSHFVASAVSIVFGYQDSTTSPGDTISLGLNK